MDGGETTESHILITILLLAKEEKYCGGIEAGYHDKHGLPGINVDGKLTRFTQLIHAIKPGALEASGSLVAALGAYGPEVEAGGEERDE